MGVSLLWSQVSDVPLIGLPKTCRIYVSMDLLLFWHRKLLLLIVLLVGVEISRSP